MARPTVEEVKREIKVGDQFFLDGKDYVIADHPTKPDVLTIFVSLELTDVEVGGKIVKKPARQGVCLKKEVIWHTKLNKWTMMGRLLPQEDKMRFQLKAVEMPWGTSQPGWGPRADDQELVRVMILNKEI